MEIPVFPLNVVLFPGMILPLHIFEERYKVMVHACLQERQPFGVALIKSGRETGATATPYDVGTMAAIKSANMVEGNQIDIVVVGLKRFRIRHLVTDKAYLSAEVTDYPMQEGDPQVARAWARRVRPLFTEYLQLLETAANVKLKLNEIPDEPETVAALIAIAMQIELRDKQRIIELENIEEMLAAECQLLSREHMILEFVMETKDRLDHLGFGPTGQMFLN